MVKNTKNLALIKELKNKSILITGGAGSVGCNVILIDIDDKKNKQLENSII